MSTVSESDRFIFVNSQSFPTYERAADYLASNTQDPHPITRRFVPRVAGRIATLDTRRYLFLEAETSGGNVRLNTPEENDGIDVVRITGSQSDIIVPLDPDASSLIDGGTSTVRVSEESDPFFCLTVKSEHEVVDPSEIAKQLSSAEEKAVSVILGILGPSD